MHRCARSAPSTFPLRPLLEEAIDAVRRDPIASTIDVTLEGGDALVTADVQMIRAAMLNLLLNAAQAMDGHGSITVSVAEAAGRCTVDVRDTGPGVPTEMCDRVFEPFFTTKARGGGLGLPIARRTAELHGGTLSLSCPAAGGAVLTLTLPCQPADKDRR